MNKIIPVFLLLVSAFAFAQPVLQVGGTFRGDLNPGQATQYDEKKVVWHTVQIARGQTVVVRAESDQDGFLYADLPDGKVLSNDDTDGLNPAVIISGINGRVRIGFAFLDVAQSGPYTLIAEPIPQGASIRAGANIQGKINSSSPTVFGKSAQVYSLAVQQGQNLVISVTSEFDNKLFVVDSAGNQYSDDDSGGDSNAKLYLRNVAQGNLTVVVYPYLDDSTGTFTMSIVLPPPPAPIQVGRTVQGNIDGTEIALGGADAYSEAVGGDEYILTVRAGQDYVVTMLSEAFDSYIGVAVNGESLSDDDGGGGTNSRLQFTANENGTAAITARPLSSGATGAYTLSVSQPVVLQTLEGNLGEQSKRDISGKYYQIHQYEGRPGQRISVRLSSSVYDTFLIIQDSRGNKLGENDDMGGGTDSLVTLELPSNGSIKIVSTTYGADATTGDYTIKIYQE